MGGLAIDFVSVFRALSVFTLVLAAPLLIVPVAHAATGREPFKRRAGLWIAGLGFLSMGLGLIDVGGGRGNLIITGAVVTVVGHLIQVRLDRGARTVADTDPPS